MTKDDEPTDDLQPTGWPRKADPRAELPVVRFDYGDAAQRAEMDSARDLVGWDPQSAARGSSPDRPDAEEPLELVDEPVRIRSLFTRAEKQRDQRPLRT